MAHVETEWLTPTEAAVVASVSVRNVHRVIDEKILPQALCRVSKDGARQIRSDACVLLSFYFESANRLTPEQRLRVIEIAAGELPHKQSGARAQAWLIREEFLSVDMSAFLRSVGRRMSRLKSARALVVEDPAILSGTPVIRGTRVPVFDIAGFVAAGDSLERILDGYPSLTLNDIELASIYSTAYPQRGRPRQSSTLPVGAVIVASYRVPRRNRGLKQAS